jgi:hypothetical protein
MGQFAFNEPKAVSAVLLVVNELKRIGKHKLAKILFFADEKHLARYGRTVTSDFYCAMPNGPVPSNIYDSVKGVNSHHRFYKYRGFEGKIKVDGIYIEALIQPDMDQLSETDIECLFDSIHENANLIFRQLTDKSHGLAYNSVPLNHQIPFIEMAKEASAPEDIMELVIMNIEAEELLSV